jgi:hypothetical protein
MLRLLAPSIALFQELAGIIASRLPGIQRWNEKAGLLKRVLI